MNTLTLVPQVFVAKLNRTLVSSVSLGLQVLSRSEVLEGMAPGMANVTSVTTVTSPSVEHTRVKNKVSDKYPGLAGTHLLHLWLQLPMSSVVWKRQRLTEELLISKVLASLKRISNMPKNCFNIMSWKTKMTNVDQ